MVTIEELTPEHYELAGQWLSNGELNKWLASEWRGRKVTDKVMSVVCMSPRNKVYLVRADGTPCGLAGLSGIDLVDHSAMCWCLLGEQQFGGKGIMSEALGILVRKAFGELGLRSLSVSVMAPNVASRRMVEKNRFRFSGTLRKGFLLDNEYVDRIVYDILPEDLNGPDATGT